MNSAARFNNLPLHDKALLVEDLATELCSIEFYDHRVYLYSLNSFFIEAYHNLDTGNTEKITVADYSDLDKFLTRIRIQPYPVKKLKNRGRNFKL